MRAENVSVVSMKGVWNRAEENREHGISFACLENRHQDCGGDAFSCKCIHHRERDLAAHFRLQSSKDSN